MLGFYGYHSLIAQLTAEHDRGDVIMDVLITNHLKGVTSQYPLP